VWAQSATGTAVSVHLLGVDKLLLIVMLAATTALTLGLMLHGVTARPDQRTRAATARPR
jgi:hypothetical protein